ncbi:FkbM family methyltransferase [Paraburkholderia sp. Tr-20389]|uniref:FkbM family methyltransferase n=1 Tax=Paraburkholderia sp. Tr-20389 TaxID=2703903 RepID=UPI00197F44CF|nr:FkbM family methyltransferase [Paraburkholderia sp. Tr-20389]MBN3757128.1 FkbM family methyltransferase [Paraburkholderia sp. Tr-20389]
MDRVSGHTFFPRFIRRDSTVVDLGANVGTFSRLMSEKYGCVCYAVEPNPDCFARLGNMARVKPFNLAIADRDGTMSFYVAANSEASSFVRTGDDDREIQVPTSRLDVFAERQGIGAIDLLKIDIEGAEVPLLDSLPDAFLRGIGQIAIEFHDFCGLVERKEVVRLEQRLEALGFRSINFSKESHGHEDHLFVNQARCPVGFVEYATTRYVTKYLLGAVRIVGRLKRGKRKAAMLPA